MNHYKITLLPGDGIGPEILEVTKELLQILSKKHNFEFIFNEQLFGGKAIDKTNNPLPSMTLESCKNSDAILLAAIGNPKYDTLPREKRPETGLLALREGLNLFANIRPVKIYPALINSSTLKKKYIQNVDLIVVRELTSGIYFGKPKGRTTTKEEERAFNTMVYSNKEIDRITKVAFELAKERKKSLCSVDKANVLDVSQLWRDRVNLLGKEYDDISVSHQYVDNAAMQLVRAPDQFDVILTSNLFGDILSDIAAMLTGSIGMLPSASLNNTGPGVFEPVHGSAPDIEGEDKANPIAMILSAVMMLKIALKETKAAEELENAINQVLNKGYRTMDLMDSDSEKLVGCAEMGDLIQKEIK